MAQLIDEEVLFLIYGVAGVGKSEFVYKAIEKMLASDPWRTARPIVVQVRSHHKVEDVLACLRLHLGLQHGQADNSVALPASLEDEMAEVALALESNRSLVFFDDFHHIDGSAAMLGYLSRSVRASRIFVASREKLHLPPWAPVPVFIELQPLDFQATTEMVTKLAQRMEITAFDAAQIHRRTHGAPFFILRELRGLARDPADDQDLLTQSLRDLDAETRRLLLVLSVIETSCKVTDVIEVVEGHTDMIGTIEALASHFLVKIDQGVLVVHDLIRDAVIGLATAEDLDASRHAAAAMHARVFARDPARNALAGVEAIRQLATTGDCAEIRALLRRCYPAIASAGLDHLLLEPMRLLEADLPEGDLDLALLRPRILLRRSQIVEAQESLAHLAQHPQALTSARYLSLAGVAARTAGAYEQAKLLLQQALQLAADPEQRFHVSLRLAESYSMWGDGASARRILNENLDEHGLQSARDRGRWNIALGVSYFVNEEHQHCLRALSEAMRHLQGPGNRDLRMICAAFALVAHLRLDEIAAARRLIDDSLAATADADLVREQSVSAFTGMLLSAEGDMHGARTVLDRCVPYLQAHHDWLLAGLAGYYQATVLLALGATDRARIVIEQSLHFNSGLLRRPEAIALKGRVLFAAGHMAAAKKWAMEVLDGKEVPAYARFTACCLLAKVHSVMGDVPGARQALSEARACISDEDNGALQREFDCEVAELAFIEEDHNRMLFHAERARKHYERCGRRYYEARAVWALAAIYAARGGAADLVMAEDWLDRARKLSTGGDYPALLLRCTLVEAALLRRRGDWPKAQEVLQAGLHTAIALPELMETYLLRAALSAQGESPDFPGIKSVMVFLGFSAPPAQYQVIDGHGCHTADNAEVDRLRRTADIIVEEDAGILYSRTSQKSIKGRLRLQAMLTRLIESGPQGMSAEALFNSVWGGKDYHPLRDRNTVDVAVNRLRLMLRELIPDKNVVLTMLGGWRLSAEVLACVIRKKSAATIDQDRA